MSLYKAKNILANKDEDWFCVLQYAGFPFAIFVIKRIIKYQLELKS